MLKKLVEDRAVSMYSEAAQRVKEVAIEECQTLGLGHGASSEMMNYSLSNDPKVPDTAKAKIMQQIVSSIEVSLGDEPQPRDALRRGLAAELPLTSESLKDMKIDDIRAICDSHDIRTVDEEGKKIARNLLVAALLKEPLKEQRE